MNNEFKCGVNFTVYLKNKELEPYFDKFDEYSEYYESAFITVDDIICERFRKLEISGEIVCFDWDFTPKQDIEYTNIFNISTKDIKIAKETYQDLLEYFENIISQFHDSKLKSSDYTSTVVISDIILDMGGLVQLRLEDVFADKPYVVKRDPARTLVYALYDTLGINC